MVHLGLFFCCHLVAAKSSERQRATKATHRINQDDNSTGKTHVYILQNSRWLSFPLYFVDLYFVDACTVFLLEPPCLGLFILTNFVACRAAAVVVIVVVLLLLVLTLRALGGGRTRRRGGGREKSSQKIRPLNKARSNRPGQGVFSSLVCRSAA